MTDTHFSERTVLTEDLGTVGKNFLFHCQSDEKVALPEKKKHSEGDRCERGYKSLHQAYRCCSDAPWDTHKHLERIVNGIDTVPRVIKNEFPCRDINTNDLSHDAFA